MMMSNVVVSMVASFINIDNATKIAMFQQRKLQCWRSTSAKLNIRQVPQADVD
jgi:hypothetical protein